MAHPIHRMVLDLSHHNTVQSFDQIKAAGIYGMIHKATEGTSYVDNKYAARKRGCAEAGLLFGAYHFANGSDPIQQADHFLSVSIDEDMLFCLDWEPNGQSTMSTEQARKWIDRVETELGRPGECVIYSGNLAKEKLGSKVDTFFGSRRLWLAQYGPNPTVQASWDDWWLWQYSDGSAGPTPHGCPGVTGAVDTNSYDGSPEQLRAQWASGRIIKPPMPEPEPLVATVHVFAPPGIKVVVHEGEPESLV